MPKCFNSSNPLSIVFYPLHAPQLRTIVPMSEVQSSPVFKVRFYFLGMPKMKIGIILISFIRSMWLFYPSILPVFGVEGVCCDNVVISKFHSFSPSDHTAHPYYP